MFIKKPSIHQSKSVKATILQMVTFVGLMVLFSLALGLLKFSTRLKFLKKSAEKFIRFVRSLDRNDQSGVSQLYLMEIAFKNMAVKRTRTLITIVGMAIGISFIVFLVSLGYGLQQVVVSRVARLDELKQAEVVPGLSEDLALTDATVSKFSAIKNVERVLPMIAVIGHVSYQNSASDLAVYGATGDYLKYSALQPVRGRLYESNATAADTKAMAVKTAKEVKVVKGEQIGSVVMNIEAGAWLKVRESPSTKAPILGYTKRIEGRLNGEEYWGDSYEADTDAGKAGTDSDGKTLGKWVEANFLLWEKKACSKTEDSECEDGGYMVMREADNSQTQKVGYVAELSMTATLSTDNADVLGVMTTDNEGSLPLVEVASESANTISQKTDTVAISSSEKKEVVVNRAVLQLLSIPETEAVGKELKLSMVVVGSLLDDPNTRVESAPIDYKITGVIPDEGTPVIYVPFMDVRSMGINKFSQMKVIAKDKSQLQAVRATIESAGFGTVSVADTVAQIDTLFANFRVILSVLGLVALSVAALGMFNTLTVSLLERTREVGLMKAMGLKSEEVKALFLTESMIMGLYGGILGLVLGSAIGKLISIVLSAFSIIQGVGVIDISFVPLPFVLFVLFLSVVVGIATGYYPAKRATKISALNALRYE